MGSVRNTRGHILAAALDLFLDEGYQRTTLRRIADGSGVSKAAVLYHFSTKAELAATLVEPFLTDLESLLARVPSAPAGETRWELVEALVDVYLTHRRLLGAMVHNVLPFLGGSAAERLVAASFTAGSLFAGPNPSLARRVQAAQLTAALTDPVLHFGEVSAEDLRCEILAGARRMLGPTVAVGRDARMAGGRRGRPRVLTQRDIATARRLRAGGERSMAEIAVALGVSRATLYRHLADADHGANASPPSIYETDQ